MTPPSAPNVKPSLVQAVKAVEAVLSALVSEQSRRLVAPLIASNILCPVVPPFLRLIQVKSGCRSLFPSCVTACVDPSPVYIVV